MAKSGADIAHEHEAITGTYDHAPSQGNFIGRLALVLMAFLVIFAIIGIVAGIRG
jgi:uncharacterized membrane protein